MEGIIMRHGTCEKPYCLLFLRLKSLCYEKVLQKNLVLDAFRNSHAFWNNLPILLRHLRFVWATEGLRSPTARIAERHDSRGIEVM